MYTNPIPLRLTIAMQRFKQVFTINQVIDRQIPLPGAFTTIAADGTIDYTYSSYNMKVQLGDPSGFLDPGARFVRLYDQNFLGGFDVHRYTERVAGTRTFNVAIDGS